MQYNHCKLACFDFLMVFSVRLSGNEFPENYVEKINYMYIPVFISFRKIAFVCQSIVGSL